MGMRCISASRTDQFRGAVAKDALGRFVVAWYETDRAGPPVPADGTPIGNAFTVTPSGDNDVFIASDDSGSFVVAWSRFVAVGPSSRTSSAPLDDSSGAPRGPEFPVNSYTTLQSRRGAHPCGRE